MGKKGKMDCTKKLELLVVLLFALALAMPMSASVAFADTSLHQTPPIEWEGYEQKCESDQELALEPGEVLWHFVLTSSDCDPSNPSGDLTATFSNCSTSPITQPPDKCTGGTLHWNIVTSQNCVLTGASTPVDGNRLNLSHVCPGEIDPPGEITACKFYDSNADGSDEGESPLSGWPMTIDPVDGADQPAIQPTEEDGCVTWTNLEEGSYTVTEGTPNETNWFHSTEISLSAVLGETVQFGNYCTVSSGGKTPGFWQNKNGQAKIDGNDLQALRDRCLVKADGSAFDPGSKDDVKNWILADAVNMAYKLSSHLAAMVLNLGEGFVNGNSFDLCSDQTVNALVTEANNALCDDGYTPAGDEPHRSEQEALKNCLDALNNNGPVVPSTPAACPYTFPTE
jgi:hypothetical protein